MISSIWFGKVYCGSEKDVRDFERAIYNSGAMARFDAAQAELDEARWLMKRSREKRVARRHRLCVNHFLAVRGELQRHIHGLSLVFRVRAFDKDAGIWLKIVDFFLYKLF